MAEIIKTKTCSKCKQIKPTSEFSKCKTEKDGCDHQCKQCRRQYRQKHRPRILQQQKQWHKNHTNYERLHRKRWRAAIRGCLYHRWEAIIQRCTNPKQKQFKDYGGRGIQVCNEWCNSFHAFYEYVKELMKQQHFDPRGLTIDRIDNDGHYEPGNIQFITKSENSFKRWREHRNRSKKAK